MKYKKTLQKGSARFIVFREGDTWYCVCLEFNIIESGSTPQEALLLLVEAVEGYLESARKIKARPGILNQKSDPEYEELWVAAEDRKKVPAKEIFSFGRLNLAGRALVAA